MRGEPLHRGYNLMDRRATREVETLKETIGEDAIFELTGNRLEDHPAIVNLLWERHNRPDSFRDVAKVLTIDGFITLKLTGVASLHYSAAPFYGVAYDLRRRRFDTGLLQRLGLDPSVIPSLYRCEEIVGRISESAAYETGLSAGTPVAAGQVDCNAGWLGAGAVEEGDIQCNLGTVGNFGVVHKSLDFIFSPIGRRMINFPYTVNSEDTYVTVPTTTTGGQTLRYVRDTFAQAELEAERNLGLSAYDLLNLQAAKVPPGSEGLIVLPFLMGERTPIWDPLARGVVFGLSLNHTKGHLIRAMMEAVAYAMYDSYRLIKEAELTMRLPMILNEGGAVSPLGRRIIADTFDVPIMLVKRREGAPFGDAVLAGVATGVFPDFSVAKSWAEYIDPMEPDPLDHEIYMRHFKLYKQLYEHLKTDFRELAALREESRPASADGERE